MQDPFNFGGAFRGVSTVCGEGRARWAPAPVLPGSGGLGLPPRMSAA